jgi:hypothetical protein
VRGGAVTSPVGTGTTRPNCSRAEGSRRDLRKMKLTEKIMEMNFLKEGHWQSLRMNY